MIHSVTVLHIHSSSLLPGVVSEKLRPGKAGPGGQARVVFRETFLPMETHAACSQLLLMLLRKEFLVSKDFSLPKDWLRRKVVSGKLMLLVSLVELLGRRADFNMVEREARQYLVVLVIEAGTRETGHDITIFQKLFFGMRLQVSKNVVLKTWLRV